jgi:hypothetical protein
MAWKPEVFVQGAWSRNGLVFATKQEAEDNAKNLMWRWLLVEDTRAVEVDEPVNYKWEANKLVPAEAVNA